MILTITDRNDALDDKGNRSQAFDAVDEMGTYSWLRPSLRCQLDSGRLDLKSGDRVFAEDFICGGGQPPILMANIIRKLPVKKD